MIVAPALKVAGALLWVLGLGFGISVFPTIRNLLAGHDLPMIMGFRAFGGGPFERLGPKAMVLLLGLSLVVNVLECVAGWLLWHGDKAGGVLALGLVPVGAVFWWGFALPIPPLVALVRTVLIILNWRTLR